MNYCTQQNIIDRYGQDQLLLIADRNNDQVVDAAVVDQAIADASAEIDVYIAAKYELPLPEVPEVIERICIDIVMYRLASTADVMTEEKRQRYEDAIALLKLIAKGEASLGLPDPPASSSGSVTVSSQERRFNRDSMKGVL